MIEKGKISNRQAMLLLIIGVLPTGILGFPALTVALAKQDAWLSIILGTAIGLAVISVAVSLGWKFPGRSIIEYSDEIVGRFLGKAVGLIYFWFFLYLTALVVRQFGEFIVSVFMEETPLIVFVVTILFAAALTVYGGLEVLGRVNELMIVLVVLSFFAFMVLGIAQMDLARLKPVLAEGIMPVVKGALPAAGWFGEVISIAFILPYLNRPGLARRSGILAIMVLCLILISAVLTSVTYFGANQTGRLQFPAFMIARNVGIAGILERSEAFFMLLWVAGVYAKIAFYYYVTVVAASQWLKLHSYRPLIFPLGICIGALAFLSFQNNPELLSFLSRLWGPYAVPIELGLPVALLLIALIRRKDGRKRI